MHQSIYLNLASVLEYIPKTLLEDKADIKTYTEGKAETDKL